MCGWPSALDYLGAAPIRGVTFGGGGESLSVKVDIRPDARSHRQLKTAAFPLLSAR